MLRCEKADCATPITPIVQITALLLMILIDSILLHIIVADKT